MSKKQRTIELLQRGWITSLECALAGGCLSLSQRATELERGGATLHRKWVQTDGGARVLAYRLGRGRVNT